MISQISPIKIELSEAEASAVIRLMLLLREVERDAEERRKQILAKFAEIEREIRARLGDLPNVPITEWSWTQIDFINGTCAAEIPSEDPSKPKEA
jgi:hypothetical protein